MPEGHVNLALDIEGTSLKFEENGAIKAVFCSFWRR
jgi:hypothetical protein